MYREVGGIFFRSIELKPNTKLENEQSIKTRYFASTAIAPSTAFSFQRFLLCSKQSNQWRVILNGAVLLSSKNHDDISSTRRHGLQGGPN